MTYYKVLDERGRSCNGGEVNWELPTKGEDGKWKPGEWMPAIKGDLELCANGYHLCRNNDLLGWLGAAIYEAEVRGEKEEGGDKIVVRECRLLSKCDNWNDKTARLFACWCVRHTPLADGRVVWDLLTDDRSRAAVDMSERYARGGATEEELAAARAAAWDAAWDAAGGAQMKKLLSILEGEGI